MSGAASTTITAAATLNNSGTVKAQSGTLSLGNYVQTGGVTDLDGGAIAGSLLGIQDGSLTGNGAISGSVTMGGTLSPGHSIGALSITGDATFTSGGIFQVELSSLNDTSDELTVAGLLDLSASDDHLTLSGGLAGQSYTIATFGSLLGEFDWVSGGYDVTYDTLGKTISVTVVPEPGTLSLLALGGLELLRRRRRA